MSVQSVMSYRENESTSIFENLREFGNLEPPGFIGRALCADDNPFHFTAANYLHVAAFYREHERHDTRFFSEESIRANGLTVPDHAPAVRIERWHIAEQGEDIEADISNYYNVQDVPGIQTIPHSIIPNLPQDQNRAIEALIAAGYPWQEARAEEVNNAIFQGFLETAHETGVTDRQAKLTAQLALKTYNLTRNYEQYPLLTETEIGYYEGHIDELYRDSVLSNKLFKSIEKGLVHPFQQEATMDLSTTDELFANLSVTYHWSEAILMDPQGQPYEARIRVCPWLIQDNQENVEELGRFKSFDREGKHYLAMSSKWNKTATYWQLDQPLDLQALSTVQDAFKEKVLYQGEPLAAHVILSDAADEERGLTLTGTDAYEFLVMLNYEDKLTFQRESQAYGCYEKTKITFNYDDICIPAGRIDLGDLELGNGKSIAEALDHFFKSGCSDEESYQEVQQKLESLKKDEDVYLTLRPDLAEKNMFDAQPYLYCCSAEQFAKLPAGFATKIIQGEEAADLKKVYVIPVKSPRPGSTSTFFSSYDPLYRLYEGIATSGDDLAAKYYQETLEEQPSMVICESGYNPQYGISKSWVADQSLCCIISKDDMDNIRNLSNINLQITQAALGYKEEESITNGPAAIENLQKLKKDIAARYTEAHQKGINKNANIWDISFDYKGAIGYHQLVQIDNNTPQFLSESSIPFPGDPKIREEFERSIKTLCKYAEFNYADVFPRYSQVAEAFRENPPALPSREESLKNMEKNKPDLTETKTSSFYNELKNYYYDIACINVKDRDNTDEFGTAFAVAMAKDGITKRTMNSVVNRIYDVYLHDTLENGINSKETATALKEFKRKDVPSR